MIGLLMRRFQFYTKIENQIFGTGKSGIFYDIQYIIVSVIVLFAVSFIVVAVIRFFKWGIGSIMKKVFAKA
jgi:hypothetical protein